MGHLLLQFKLFFLLCINSNVEQPGLSKKGKTRHMLIAMNAYTIVHSGQGWILGEC